MRNYNRAFDTCDFRCREVCDIMFYFSSYKCIYHCLGIYQYIPCKVQHDHSFFHKTQCIFSDHAFRTVKCRYMHRDIITVFINFIYICCMMDTS